MSDEQLRRAIEDRDELQRRIDAYEGRLEEWEEIDRLIAASSLGTPESVAMREQVPPQLSKVLVRAIQAKERADVAEAERDRLRAVVRKVVVCAGIALEGKSDEWLSYACEEYAGPHEFDPDELAAYRRALDVSPTGEDT